MLETDAPYLLPRDLPQKPVEKNRNEPCYLPHIAKYVAKYMAQEETELVAAAYKNSCEFLRNDCKEDSLGEKCFDTSVEAPTVFIGNNKWKMEVDGSNNKYNLWNRSKSTRNH